MSDTKQLKDICNSCGEVVASKYCPCCENYLCEKCFNSPDVICNNCEFGMNYEDIDDETRGGR